MGLGLEDFLNLTPFEFQAVYLKHIEKIEKEREWETNTRWQIARWKVFRTLCPPQQKSISIFDLIELPGDEIIRQRKKSEETTPEKFEEAKRRMGSVNLKLVK